MAAISDNSQPTTHSLHKLCCSCFCSLENEIFTPGPSGRLDKNHTNIWNQSDWSWTLGSILTHNFPVMCENVLLNLEFYSSCLMYDIESKLFKSNFVWYNWSLSWSHPNLWHRRHKCRVWRVLWFRALLSLLAVSQTDAGEVRGPVTQKRDQAQCAAFISECCIVFKGGTGKLTSGAWFETGGSAWQTGDGRVEWGQPSLRALTWK